MVITKSEPYSLSEINQLKEQFGDYIKTVIDLNKKICCAGVNLHADGEKLLINQGSSQLDLWGGGLDLLTKSIDYNALINIRPNQQNTSDEIQDPVLRQKYTEFTKFFFKAIYD
jgi:hypothetical protein